MDFKRILTLATCLGVACLMLTGSAMAGTTAVTGGVVNYAREVGAVNTIYTVPAPKTVTRAMNVIRTESQDFFVRVTLGAGLQFATGGLPAAGNLTYAGTSGGTVLPSTIVGGGADGNTSVTFFVDVTNVFTGFPTFNLATGGWFLRDTTNALGGGSSYTIAVETFDSGTGTIFDVGTDSVNFLTGLFAIANSTVVSTTATVDVATGRLNFVVGTGAAADTLTNDNGATIDLKGVTAGINNAAGAAYMLDAASSLQLVLTGNLDGITNWAFDTAGVNIVDTVTSSEVTAGSTTLSVPGNSAGFSAGGKAVSIRVTGTTALTGRTLSVAVNLVLSGAAGYPTANNRSLLSSSTLTVWSLNGTVLIANWANGNNASLLSRIYLWNPSTTGGAVTARVFTLPLGFGGSTLLGTVSLGTLASASGANVRVAEDLLTPLGITLPYVTDGGNLVIEFTIQATNVSGYTQSFSSTLAFGTTPLSRVP